MKIGVALACFVAVASPAVANDCIPGGVEVVGWSAKFYDEGSGVAGGQTDITLGLRNLWKLDIVMIEATATFVDALGNVVEPFPLQLDPDLALPAGSPGNMSYIGHRGPSRLVEIDKGLVTPSLCVTGVVFSDGTVLKQQ